MKVSSKRFLVELTSDTTEIVSSKIRKTSASNDLLSISDVSALVNIKRARKKKEYEPITCRYGECRETVTGGPEQYKRHLLHHTKKMFETVLSRSRDHECPLCEKSNVSWFALLHHYSWRCDQFFNVTKLDKEDFPEVQRKRKRPEHIKPYRRRRYEFVLGNDVKFVGGFLDGVYVDEKFRIQATVTRVGQETNQNHEVMTRRQGEARTMKLVTRRQFDQQSERKNQPRVTIIINNRDTRHESVIEDQEQEVVSQNEDHTYFADDEDNLDDRDQEDRESMDEGDTRKGSEEAIPDDEDSRPVWESMEENDDDAREESEEASLVDDHGEEREEHRNKINTEDDRSLDILIESSDDELLQTLSQDDSPDYSSSDDKSKVQSVPSTVTPEEFEIITIDDDTDEDEDIQRGIAASLSISHEAVEVEGSDEQGSSAENQDFCCFFCNTSCSSHSDLLQHQHSVHHARGWFELSLSDDRLMSALRSSRRGLCYICINEPGPNHSVDVWREESDHQQHLTLYHKISTSFFTLNLDDDDGTDTARDVEDIISESDESVSSPDVEPAGVTNESEEQQIQQSEESLRCNPDQDETATTVNLPGVTELPEVFVKKVDEEYIENNIQDLEIRSKKEEEQEPFIYSHEKTEEDSAHDNSPSKVETEATIEATTEAEHNDDVAEEDELDTVIVPNLMCKCDEFSNHQTLQDLCTGGCRTFSVFCSGVLGGIVMAEVHDGDGELREDYIHVKFVSNLSTSCLNQVVRVISGKYILLSLDHTRTDCQHHEPVVGHQLGICQKWFGLDPQTVRQESSVTLESLRIEDDGSFTLFCTTVLAESPRTFVFSIGNLDPKLKLCNDNKIVSVTRRGELQIRVQKEDLNYTPAPSDFIAEISSPVSSLQTKITMNIIKPNTQELNLPQPKVKSFHMKLPVNRVKKTIKTPSAFNTPDDDDSESAEEVSVLNQKFNKVKMSLPRPVPAVSTCKKCHFYSEEQMMEKWLANEISKCDSCPSHKLRVSKKLYILPGQVEIATVSLMNISSKISNLKFCKVFVNSKKSLVFPVYKNSCHYSESIIIRVKDDGTLNVPLENNSTNSVNLGPDIKIGSGQILSIT